MTVSFDNDSVFAHIRRPVRAALLALPVLAVLGCASPAEQAATYYKNGMALLESGDLVKARLEFQNALQLTQSMTDAVFGLALIAEREGDWERMFALLTRVVAQDPRHLQAQVKLGRLLVAAGQVDGALKASNAALEIAPEEPDALALRAAVLFKLDDHTQAVAQANAALAKDPDHGDALVVLASERMAAGDAEKAIEYLDRGLRSNERNLALQLIKIQALESLGKPELVESTLRKLAKLYPEARQLRHVLAKVYIGHGKQDEAEAEYRAVAAENPADPDAKLDVVRFLAEVRGHDAAIAELNGLIEKEPGNTKLKFALAGLRRHNGDTAAADALLREIINNAPEEEDRLTARGQLAASLLAAGDRAGAERLLAELLAKDARNEQGLLLKANMAIDDRKLDEAVAHLRTVLRDAPNSPRALLLLGHAHDLSGSQQLAEEHFVRAFQASRLAPEYGIAYAEHLLKRGQLARAEDVLDDVLRVSPGHLQTLALLAQVRLRRGDWVGAEQVAEEIRRQGNPSHISDRILGSVHAGRKDFEASVAAYKRAYDSSPGDVQPLVGVVRTYLAAGKAKEAMGFLQSVLQASPDNASARLLLGQLHMVEGRRDQAEATFRALIEDDPVNSNAYTNLAGLYLRERRLADAEKVVNKGLAVLPGDRLLRLTQTAIYEMSGRFDDAIALYEELLREQPEADVLANNLASLLSEQRDDRASLERAYELARRFERSSVPQFKDTLGWVKYKLGKFDEAAPLLQGAVEQMPELPVLRYHLGMSYAALNNKDAARRELEKALALAGDQPAPFVEEARKVLQSL